MSNTRQILFIKSHSSNPSFKASLVQLGVKHINHPTRRAKHRSSNPSHQTSFVQPSHQTSFVQPVASTNYSSKQSHQTSFVQLVASNTTRPTTGTKVHSSSPALRIAFVHQGGVHHSSPSPTIAYHGTYPAYRYQTLVTVCGNKLVEEINGKWNEITFTYVSSIHTYIIAKLVKDRHYSLLKDLPLGYYENNFKSKVYLKSCMYYK